MGLGYRVALPGGVQISKAFVGKRGASLKMYHRLQQLLRRGWCGKVTRATAVEGGVLRTRWASWEMKRTSETTRGCVLAGPRPEAGEEAALALVLSSCLAVRYAQKLIVQDFFTVNGGLTVELNDPHMVHLFKDKPEDGLIAHFLAIALRGPSFSRGQCKPTEGQISKPRVPKERYAQLSLMNAKGQQRFWPCHEKMASTHHDPTESKHDLC